MVRNEAPCCIPGPAGRNSEGGSPISSDASRHPPERRLNRCRVLRRTGAARFLGYEITVHHADHKLTNGRRSVNGKVALRVPRDVITAKSAPFMKLGKPERRPDLRNLTDNQIIGKGRG